VAQDATDEEDADVRPEPAVARMSSRVSAMRRPLGIGSPGSLQSQPGVVDVLSRLRAHLDRLEDASARGAGLAGALCASAQAGAPSCGLRTLCAHAGGQVVSLSDCDVTL
jgi:hypothetical protein